MKSKKNNLSISQRLSNVSGVPFDVMTSVPYVLLCANREVTIEDAGKLMHYDKGCVKVKQRKATVNVSGNDLKIVYLANNDLRVCGFINGVSFE